MISEDGASTLRNGITTPMQETPKSSLAPSAMWRHSEKTAVLGELGRKLSPDTESAGTLILDF